MVVPSGLLHPDHAAAAAGEEAAAAVKLAAAEFEATKQHSWLKLAVGMPAANKSYTPDSVSYHTLNNCVMCCSSLFCVLIELVTARTAPTRQMQQSCITKHKCWKPAHRGLSSSAGCKHLLPR